MRDPLDEDVARVVASVADLDVLPWHEMGVDRARQVEDDLFSGDAGPPVECIHHRHLPGPAGDVPIRVYDPDGATEPSPGLVFCHGGGWILGTLDSADDLCRHLARGTGSVVVSVDYRLAPEHTFPAAVSDAAAAFEWVRTDADAVGIDPERLGVAGSSAGGGLAAALPHHDAVDPESIAQAVLLYPMLDADFERASYAENADGPLLTADDVAWFWEQYCPDERDRTRPTAAPLRADDVAGCPPTTVVTGGHDPLRDEGVAYVERLREAGVPVDHHHEPSMPHGFLSLTDEAPAAAAAMDAVTESVATRWE